MFASAHASTSRCSRPFFIAPVTAAQYRSERMKHYRAMLSEWRRLVDDMPKLIDDIRDLERHVNQITGVEIEREQAQRGGRRRIVAA